MRIQLRDDTNDVGRNEQRENVLKQMREAVAKHNTEGVTRAMQQYMNDWVAFVRSDSPWRSFIWIS